MFLDKRSILRQTESWTTYVRRWVIIELIYFVLAGLVESNHANECFEAQICLQFRVHFEQCNAVNMQINQAINQACTLS